MSSKEKSQKKILPVRGYLLHITHYDPVWIAAKDKEEPFDIEVGMQVIDAMAEAGLNLLMLDVKDGIRYSSHPELTRHYSCERETLTRLAQHAKERSIETVIKLNFSQSPIHQHNHWFRPHNDLFDSLKYWKLAFEIIDELLELVPGCRFFHIGMDEDHSRSYGQYVEAIKTLHAGLAERKLRTLIWNDSACRWASAAIHRDKSLEAERLAPKDITHVFWDYDDWDPEGPSRIRGLGLDLWGAPGGRPELVARMRDRLLDAGGSGILLTQWTPCVPARRDALLERIRLCGPACRG